MGNRNIFDIISFEFQDRRYKEFMREQDRIKLRAFLDSRRRDIFNLKTRLQSELDQTEQELNQFHSEFLVEQTKAGLKGKAADSAEHNLKNMPKCNLDNPIKI